MIADIFCPIFTITITILACFTRKKKGKLFRGFAPTRSPRHHPGLHGGGEGGGAYSSPRTPSFSIVFGFSKNRCTHIFSVLSPVYAFSRLKHLFHIIVRFLIFCHFHIRSFGARICNF